MSVTVNTVDGVVVGIAPLVIVQLPLLLVTQLPVPPGANEPLTVALATSTFLSTLRTVTVTIAIQSPCPFFALPASVFTAIDGSGGSVGVPVPSAYSSRLGDPVPMDVRRPGVAWAARKVLTASGVAVGF